LGKVICVEGDDVFVYFKGINKPVPEDRVSRFGLPADFLEVVRGIEDPELGNLPPYTRRTGASSLRKARDSVGL
jgi:hypothetical protein